MYIKTDTMVHQYRIVKYSKPRIYSELVFLILQCVTPSSCLLLRRADISNLSM